MKGNSGTDKHGGKDMSENEDVRIDSDLHYNWLRSELDQAIMFESHGLNELAIGKYYRVISTHDLISQNIDDDKSKTALIERINTVKSRLNQLFSCTGMDYEKFTTYVENFSSDVLAYENKIMEECVAILQFLDYLKNKKYGATRLDG